MKIIINLGAYARWKSLSLLRAFVVFGTRPRTFEKSAMNNVPLPIEWTYHESKMQVLEFWVCNEGLKVRSGVIPPLEHWGVQSHIQGISVNT